MKRGHCNSDCQCNCVNILGPIWYLSKVCHPYLGTLLLAYLIYANYNFVSTSPVLFSASGRLEPCLPCQYHMQATVFSYGLKYPCYFFFSPLTALKGPLVIPCHLSSSSFHRCSPARAAAPLHGLREALISSSPTPHVGPAPRPGGQPPLVGREMDLAAIGPMAASSAHARIRPSPSQGRQARHGARLEAPVGGRRLTAPVAGVEGALWKRQWGAKAIRPTCACCRSGRRRGGVP
jgi:hypothetical protein